MKKAQHINEILENVKSRHTWECDLCDTQEISENNDTRIEFIHKLYLKGVRQAVIKDKQGVFCKDCWSDPEIQNSTL